MLYSPLKLDMVKAELELYEEQCNGVTKKLQELTGNLTKINEEREAMQRCCSNNFMSDMNLCVHVFSKLITLQETCTAKKKQLTKAEQEMESITVKEDSLSKHLKNVRLQVDEAKSALQAQRNR